MKIVNISGGLGNQMFQYAFALRLQDLFPSDNILIDTTHYHYIYLKKWKTSNLHNGYEIDKIFPNANIKQAKAKDLIKVTWYMPNYWLSRIVRKLLPKRKFEYIQIPPKDTTYDSEALQNGSIKYYEGYWQAISYYLPIKDKLLYLFQHPVPNTTNANYINKIKNSNSVGIHIRRGDYLYFDDYKGICDLEYYKKAIKEILRNDTHKEFYIFSNDILWCEKNIIPLLGKCPFHLVTCNQGAQSYWDMFLMTYCKDLIIANSSFSWWGAFLNTRKGIIISPNKWNNRNCEFDYWDPSWIRL